MRLGWHIRRQGPGVQGRTANASGFSTVDPWVGFVSGRFVGVDRWGGSLGWIVGVDRWGGSLGDNDFRSGAIVRIQFESC